jgi:hypothetical protein
MLLINLEYKRQTGRTTRMLADVKMTFEEGKDCVIIVRDCDHEIRRIAYLLDMPIPNSWNDKPNIILLRHDMITNFDWTTLKFTDGPYVDAEVFVNHDVLEDVYRHILNIWTKYDEPPAAVPGLANSPEEVQALLHAAKEAPPSPLGLSPIPGYEARLPVPDRPMNPHIGRGLTTPVLYGEDGKEVG